MVEDFGFFPKIIFIIYLRHSSCSSRTRGARIGGGGGEMSWFCPSCRRDGGHWWPPGSVAFHSQPHLLHLTMLTPQGCTDTAATETVSWSDIFFFLKHKRKRKTFSFVRTTQRKSRFDFNKIFFLIIVWMKGKKKKWLERKDKKIPKKAKMVGFCFVFVVVRWFI